MRRIEDFPLQKVTLNLFEGEFARLQSLYPNLGAGRVVRDLVHSHLRSIDEKTNQRLPGIEQLNLSPEDADIIETL